MTKVVLGLTYRWFTDVTKWLKVPTMMCWSVNRGKDLSPVVSCEGKHAEPFWVYVQCELDVLRLDQLMSGYVNVT